MKLLRTVIYVELALALGVQSAFAEAGGVPAELAARIDAEALARMTADEDLRSSMSEGGLSGRYAVVGTALCTRSSAGFRTDFEFVPALVPGSTVQPQSFTYRGIRTFDANGTAQGASTVYSLSYPAFVFQASFANTGFGSVVEVEQDFSYTIGPDRTLTMTGQGSHGTVIQGGSGVGAAITTTGAPPLTGAISKDWRTVVLTNAAMTVEHSFSTSPAGVTSDTPRICTRSETLTKLAD